MCVCVCERERECVYVCVCVCVCVCVVYGCLCGNTVACHVEVNDKSSCLTTKTKQWAHRRGHTAELDNWTHPLYGDSSTTKTQHKQHTFHCHHSSPHAVVVFEPGSGWNERSADNTQTPTKTTLGIGREDSQSKSTQTHTRKTPHPTCQTLNAVTCREPSSAV